MHIHVQGLDAEKLQTLITMSLEVNDS